MFSLKCLQVKGYKSFYIFESDIFSFYNITSIWLILNQGIELHKNELSIHKLSVFIFIYIEKKTMCFHKIQSLYWHLYKLCPGPIMDH